MKTHKVRFLLSLLGVSLSMGATTAMVSFQRGADVYLKTLVEDMGGSGLVQVVSKPPASGSEKILFGRSKGLRISDADSLETVAGTGTIVFRAVEKVLPVVFRSNQEKLIARGVDKLAMEEGEKILLQSGRFFSDEEYAKGARVCVIGWKLAEEAKLILQANRSELIGQSIKIGSQRYRIAGIFTKKYLKWESPGYVLYMPMAAMLKDFAGRDPLVDRIDFRIPDMDARPEAMDSFAAYFKKSHRGAEDIAFDRLTGARDVRIMMNNLTLTFLAVIIVSMIIGCTNILNLMLSTLSERVVEIGLRKSLGATRLDILLQFLMESVTVSLLGGIAGCAIGMAALPFADSVQLATGGLRPQLDPRAFTAIFLMSVTMGIVSGLYPAFKGAAMNPVDALKWG